MEQVTELIRIPIEMDITFNYTAGRYFTYFYQQLKEFNRIMGTRCPQCRKVYLPPRPFCGECHRRMEEWTEVGPEGVLVGYTAIYFPFHDASTGGMRQIPFGAGLIQLDGADTALNHCLSESDVKRLRIGLRVRAVFKENREGNIGDILYFQVL
jgi:uncharacterized OB-fold protein